MNESTMSIVLIVLMLVGLYFLLIRPQQKRMRQQMELIKGLHEGDDVMTSSGIYGTVTEVEEETVLLEVAEQVEIRVAKSAITRTFTEHEEPEEEEPEASEEEEETEAELGEAEEEAAEEPEASDKTSKGKK